MQDWEMRLEEPPCGGGDRRKHKCRMCGEPATCMTWRVYIRYWWCSRCYDLHEEERDAYSAQQHSTQKGRWDWWDWRRGRHVKIRYLDEQVELGKRTYLPIIVTDTCPTCGDVRANDLRDMPLDYPCVNGEVEISFVCGTYLYDDDPKHQHEGLNWTRKLKLRVHLEQVKEKG